ncbi:hypothetical protein DCE93_06550 [Agromyces badenianii]|uniref:Phosphoribosyltransferase domain-containing protein n=1 Tax=Agromyces badenianii TaxID=2080742 RepID=A0A2S0WZR6_9MICO|nr:phosphoribosyltransferase [Agromyces badenianii]AWB96843.1 hypothetical protein DCE93_06550 [Agromyces badenianii]
MPADARVDEVRRAATTLASAHEPAAAPISFRIGDELQALVLPPGALEGVCVWCHGLLADRVDLCFNCDENSRALDGVVQPIIPISLYAKPSPLRDWLTFYKDDGEVAADPSARDAIGTVLERFFTENEAWVTRLGADGAIIVPSTFRPPPHPLAVLVRERGSLPFEVLHGLSRTSANLGHNQPNTDAFDASDDLRGKRILLLDDVYTSGARAQSAAYALRRVGAEIVALCIIGRRYNPGYSEQSSAVFSRQSAETFTWTVDVRDATRT